MLRQEKTDLRQEINTKRIRIKQNKEKFQKELIDFCNEPRTLEEITTKFGFKDKYRFKKVYIEPILDKRLFIHKSSEHKVYFQKYINTKE